MYEKCSVNIIVALLNQYNNPMIRVLLFHFAVGKIKALEGLSSQPKVINGRAVLEIDQK